MYVSAIGARPVYAAKKQVEDQVPSITQKACQWVSWYTLWHGLLLLDYASLN